MTNTLVPLRLIPSTLLCYPSFQFTPEVRRLIERCQETWKREDQAEVDNIVFEAAHLGRSQADACQRGVLWVYLGDMCWLVGRPGQAERYYRESEEIFSTRCDAEHRQHEAAAAYGQGLVHQQRGALQEAHRCYSRALSMLEKSRTHWGSLNRSDRYTQCGEVTEQIEQLKKLTLDAPTKPSDVLVTSGREGAGVAPFLVGVIPADGSNEVPIDTSLLLAFSQSMQTGTLDLSIQPDDRVGHLSSLAWCENSMIAVLAPQDCTLDYATNYRISIVSARDQDGTLLKDGDVPRSWAFTTEARPPSPVEVLQFLGSGQPLPPETPIALVFNQPMDRGSLKWKVEPQAATLSPPEWDSSGTIAVFEYPWCAKHPDLKFTLTHAMSTNGQSLSRTVTAMFTFQPGAPPTTAAPQVLDSFPLSGPVEVQVDLPVAVLFSKPIGSSRAQIRHRQPASVREEQLGKGTIVVVGHANYLFDQSVHLELMAKDLNGVDLSAPFQRSFRTPARPKTGARILGVVPMDHQTHVPVVIRPAVMLTQEADASPAGFAWSFTPPPRSTGVVRQLMADRRIVIMRPDVPELGHGELYSWQITKALTVHRESAIGAQPYSWSFRTKDAASATPDASFLWPRRGATNVDVSEPIVVRFSEPMDPDTFEFQLEPEVDIHGVRWQLHNRYAIVEHADFRHEETYTASVKQVHASRRNTPLVQTTPVTWAFTTRKRSKPLISYTYPAHRDVNVPLDAPIIIRYSRPVRNPLLRPKLIPKPPPDLVFIQTNSPDGLETRLTCDPAFPEDSEVHIELITIQDMHGPIPIDQFPLMVNPWRFHTVSRLPWWRQFDRVSLLSIIAAGVIVALSAVIGAFVTWNLVPADSLDHRVLMVLLTLGAFTVTLVGTVLLIALFLQRLRIVFAVGDREEALVGQDGQVRAVEGANNYVWRLPLVEQLKAIVPLSRKSLRLTGCQMPTHSSGELAELGVDIEYTVLNSIDAFQWYEQITAEEKKKPDVARSRELEAAWEKELRQLVEYELSNRVCKVSYGDLKKHQRDLELDMLQALNNRTRRTGIEVQRLELVKIKPAMES